MIHKYLPSLAAFAAGLITSALTCATFLWVISGLLAPIPTRIVQVVFVTALAALLLRDLGVVRFQLPENHWQVPQSVLGKSGLQPAFRFGAELGTGFRTYVPASVPYMLALAILLLPVPWGSVAAASIGFALGRAITPAVRMFSGAVSAWDGLLERRLPVLTASGAVVAALLTVRLTFSS